MHDNLTFSGTEEKVGENAQEVLRQIKAREQYFYRVLSEDWRATCKETQIHSW